MSVLLHKGSFLLAVAAILLTPGPTNTLLATSGSGVGVRRSLPLLAFEGLGYLLAITLWGGLLVSVAHEHPLVVRAIQLGCGLYIAALSWRLWRQAARHTPVAQAPVVSGRALFTTTLLNPKAAIFGMALFPAETWESLANYGAVMAAFLAVLATVGSLWIALGAALVGGRLRWLRPQAFQRGAGLVLAGFAVWMGFNALAA